jgi:putative ABC transport system permease protein
MFNLERAINEWRRGCRKVRSLEDGALAELEGHLRDEFARRKASGAKDEDAFAAATASIGRPEAVGAEYFKEGAAGSHVLLASHVKVALRKLKLREGTALLNVLGLAVGLAACLLILMWVRDELGFDRFHRDGDRLYRLVLVDKRAEGTSYIRELPSPVAPALLAGFPEVEAAARTYGGRFQVRHGDKAFNENAVNFADPAYFRIFSFPAVSGDPVAGLASPSSVVLTEETARKYFGDDEALGRTLNFDGQRDYTVAAVVHVPRNTDLGFDIYLPLRALEHWGVGAASLESNWRGRMYRTYVRLIPGADPRALEDKTAGLMKPHNPNRDEAFRLQPLAQWHLYAPDGTPAGKRLVVVLSLIAALILVIACVNFMSLATARAGSRAMEVSLRKAVGASRLQLIRQIVVESLAMSVLALGLSLVLVSAALPAFGRLTGKALEASLGHPAVLLGALGLSLLAGLLAGAYPALVLSSFEPAAVLKGRAASPRRGAGLRRGLLFFQFGVSVILLVATAVILSQIRFIQTRDIGFDRKDLVYVAMMGSNRDNAEALKRELARHPAFLGASACNNLPTQILYQYSADWEGRAPGDEVEFNYTVCDFDYVRTFGMTIIEGRDFSPDRPADAETFLVNEEAARRIGRPSAVGTRLRFMDGHWGEIIGIVKDFNFRYMGQPIRPLVLTPKGRKGLFVARLRPGDPGPAIRILSEAWNRVNPGFVFEPGSVEQNFDALYRHEGRLAKIVGSFSVLAVLISCFGIIGLAAHTVERKTKEIGIRKVLGAGAAEIVRMIAADFLRWVALANLIAWPVAAWVMGRWLENFAYRTGLAAWMFVLPAAASVLCALATVSVQVVRAALADPVESLRVE